MNTRFTQKAQTTLNNALSFAGELGRTHRAEQVSRCDYYLSALGEERRRLADALPGRLRTGSTLCITCALAMAVLLW